MHVDIVALLPTSRHALEFSIECLALGWAQVCKIPFDPAQAHMRVASRDKLHRIFADLAISVIVPLHRKLRSGLQRYSISVIRLQAKLRG
jgi:hypothetical protein